MARNLDITIKFFHLNKTTFSAHWFREQLQNSKDQGSNPARNEMNKT